MKYSIQEALRELRNPKKNLKEGFWSDYMQEIKSRLQAIEDPQLLIKIWEKVGFGTKLTYFNEQRLTDFINQFFEKNSQMKVDLDSSKFKKPNPNNKYGYYIFNNANEVLNMIKQYPNSFWDIDEKSAEDWASTLEGCSRKFIISELLKNIHPLDLKHALDEVVPNNFNQNNSVGNNKKQGLTTKISSANTPVKLSLSDVVELKADALSQMSDDRYTHTYKGTLRDCLADFVEDGDFYITSKEIKQGYSDDNPEIQFTLQDILNKLDNTDGCDYIIELSVKRKKDNAKEILIYNGEPEDYEEYDESVVKPGTSKKKITESPKKFEDKDAEEEYFRHIQELSTDYEDSDAEEYDEDDYDEEEDIEESCTLKESNDIVTAVFKDNGFDKGEFEEAYPELMSRLEFDTRKFDNRENQLAYCDIYVKGKREDVEEFIQKSIWDYGCDTKEEAEELYGEGCIPTIIDESLNEDAKFITAATILKKEQAAIFAQTTEEGMRKMVLDILDKNKDKMKPENYNTVVKTMKNCPKRAVPSTVWTMLNPNQKVGK